MSERKTALLFFQKDIEEAFHLWCEAHKLDIGPFVFQVNVRVGHGLVRYLIFSTSYVGNVKVGWRGFQVSFEDLSKALELLIFKRNLEIEGGYFLRESVNLTREMEYAAIPHSHKI